MGKYICLCGSTYHKKELADLHAKIYEDLALSEGFPRHKIFVQHWQARLASVRWGRFFRFTGAYMVYLVFITHVYWSWLEATLIGIGMGLYIE